MPSDAVCSASASLRDVENCTPGATQDCSDVVHIAVFFDGTGNNKKKDEDKQSWTNVARIWLSSDFISRNKDSNAYSIYISGVGTEFNGKAFFPGEESAIALEDGDVLGGGAGAGGSRRLDYGQQKINNVLRDALLNRAKILGGKVAKYAAAGSQQSFSEVNKALGSHRLIKQINVSIFGFSRGASLARAFCNQWLWECAEDRGQLSYEGYPIRFVFLGLFDTVASFGLPATNLSNNPVFNGFDGRDLVVDERVERCVHLVAAHELRFAFPVDLIRRDGRLAGNWLEKTYPGVHADIGGGYEPEEQGIANNYSRIPMRDMMREALLQGTRLLGYDDIEARSIRTFQERFECKKETSDAYEAYIAVCAPDGTIEQQAQRHMEQLYSAYGTLHRRGGESVTQRQHREGKSWSSLAPADMATELEKYKKTRQEFLSEAGIRRAEYDPIYATTKAGYIMWISPDKWQLDAWDRTASEGVMNFVHTFLHDSKVGFLSNAEPFSYFSKRGIDESSRSVHGWYEDNVERPVDHAYESTVDAVSRGIDKTVEVAKETKDVVVEKAQQAKEVVVEKAQQAKEAIVETADKAQKAATEATKKAQEVVTEKAGQAGHAISETASKAQRAATEAGHKIGEAASSAMQKGQQALQSTGEAISQTTEEAVNGLKSAWNHLFL